MSTTAEIERLKRKIAELEAEKDTQEKYWASLTDEQKVAELWHKRFCHSNHTDYCDYYYGDWKNLSWARIAALKKAKQLIAVEPDVENLIRILRVL